MRKIVGYMLIEAHLGKIELDVNDCINRGWQPYGEIKLRDSNYLLQAMVKYGDEKEDSPITQEEVQAVIDSAIESHLDTFQHCNQKY